MKSRKLKALSMVMLGFALYGCGGSPGPAPQTDNESIINAFDTPTQEAPEGQEISKAKNMPQSASETEGNLPAEAVQGGPYGKITLSIPEGWGFEACPMDSEKLSYGMYGIRFYPKEAEEGFVELVYTDFFGVCGTGLKSESVQLAGQQASVGTYDEHAWWDFVSFQDAYKGIVANSYQTEAWQPEFQEQALKILDTLSFEPDEREGSAYVYHKDSEAEKIGLMLSLKKVTSVGAVLVFDQYDSEVPTGELEVGEDFALEVQKDGIWEAVPVVLEGEAAFHDVAHILALGQSTEMDLNWEWLYGMLPAGEYRIKKEILDFRGTGDYDKHTVYAHFIVT